MADQNLPAAPSAVDPSQALAAAPAPADAPAPPPAAAPTALAAESDGSEPAHDDDAAARQLFHTRSRLLELARVDSDNAAKLVQSRNDFARRGELVGKAIPEKYLELVGAMRTAVRAYNDALLQLPDNPIPPIHWYESPNVVLREPTLGDGMRVRLTRVHAYFELVLRYVNRNNKPDVPLIEGYGDFGRDMVKRKMLMRIEGWVERGEVIYWYNLNFKRMTIPLREIPDRIVMAVASSDYTHLSRDYKDDENRFESGPDPSA